MPSKYLLNVGQMTDKQYGAINIGKMDTKSKLMPQIIAALAGKKTKYFALHIMLLMLILCYQ